MSLKPLVIDAGQIRQLPSGESIDVGGWTLPSSGGAEAQLLQADASGNASWRSNLAYTYAPVNDSGEHGIRVFYDPSATLDGRTTTVACPWLLSRTLPVA